MPRHYLRTGKHPTLTVGIDTESETGVSQGHIQQNMVMYVNPLTLHCTREMDLLFSTTIFTTKLQKISESPDSNLSQKSNLQMDDYLFATLSTYPTVTGYRRK
jgi:hypothetical protein